MRVTFQLLLLCLLVPLSLATYGAYFVNWAHYRPSPYTYTASNLAPIIPKIDELYYGFYYFCPPAGTNPMPYWAQPPYGSCSDSTEYQLMSVEPADTQYIPQIVGYKSVNPNLKVYVSVGGWNFPSNYFSQMVSSSQNRTKFIQSALSLINQYSLDGIDIDWEFPCSPARDNPVEISCSLFRTVHDNGGSCPDDSKNIVQFAKEFKAALGSKLLTFASQAAKKNENNMNLLAVTPYIDKWHVMTYDYSVSDLPDASAALTAPNCPLYNPLSPSPQMSVNKTIQDYLTAGVPASKIMLGLPLYGHTWYAPTAGSGWNKFSVTGQVQGSCCGPFQNTYGAQPGQGSSLCGTMMYSETQAAQPQQSYTDPLTQSVIAYWTTTGADGVTAAGTWLSYNDANSMSTIVKYGQTNNLDGAFIFDTSMDSISGGSFTYELMNAVATALGK